MKSTLLGICLLTFITACGGNSHYTSSSFKAADFDKKNFGIMMLDKSQVNVSLKDDYIDDFPEISIADIDQHAAKLLNQSNLKALKSNLEKKQSKLIAISPFKFSTDNSEEFYQDLSKISKAKGIIKLNTPKSQHIKTIYPDMDFLIVISNAYFGFETSLSNPVSSSQPHVAGITHRALQLRYDYVVKDLARNEIVSAGITNAIASANYYIGKEDWLKIIDEAIIQVIEQTQLDK